MSDIDKPVKNKCAMEIVEAQLFNETELDLDVTNAKAELLVNCG